MNFWRLILWFFSFLFYSKDLQFGVKFKPKPHSGWHDNEDYIEDVWVEELEPILECGSSITGYDVSESWVKVLAPDRQVYFFYTNMN